MTHQPHKFHWHFNCCERCGITTQLAVEHRRYACIEDDTNVIAVTHHIFARAEFVKIFGKVDFEMTRSLAAAPAPQFDD